VAECDHLIERRDCGDCNRRVPQVVPGNPALYGPWFIAAYDGDCSGCGADFEDGDEIRADGEGGWLARCCGADDEPARRAEPPRPAPDHKMSLLEQFVAGNIDTGSGT
jgi:hypothetical protein